MGRLPDLVLASTSTYRRELLARLGLAFRAQAPAMDEEAAKRALPPGLAPERLAATLAKAKAVSLAGDDLAVLGADQVAALGDRVLGKPGSAEEAARQLSLLSGRTHVLVTAVAIVHGEAVHEHVDVTKLSMRPLSPGQIERYVAADAPIDCAGSYRLEARGIALFERIESADHTAIVGLPLMAVTSMLAAMGYPVP
jgi:septum formation protein